MKKRVLLIGIVSVSVLFSVALQPVNATDYLCDINHIGSSSDGTAMCQLTCTGLAAGSWFYAANAASSNKMLGIALTALTLDKQVIIVMSSTSEPYLINSIFIKK